MGKRTAVFLLVGVVGVGVLGAAIVISSRPSHEAATTQRANSSSSSSTGPASGEASTAPAEPPPGDHIAFTTTPLDMPQSVRLEQAQAAGATGVLLERGASGSLIGVVYGDCGSTKIADVRFQEPNTLFIITKLNIPAGQVCGGVNRQIGIRVDVALSTGDVQVEVRSIG